MSPACTTVTDSALISHETCGEPRPSEAGRAVIENRADLDLVARRAGMHFEGAGRQRGFSLTGRELVER
jgi:hypothetical protein